jgi:hypothetical protein
LGLLNILQLSICTGGRRTDVANSGTELSCLAVRSTIGNYEQTTGSPTEHFIDKGITSIVTSRHMAAEISTPTGDIRTDG